MDNSLAFIISPDSVRFSSFRSNQPAVSLSYSQWKHKNHVLSTQHLRSRLFPCFKSPQNIRSHSKLTTFSVQTQPSSPDSQSDSSSNASPFLTPFKTLKKILSGPIGLVISFYSYISIAATLFHKVEGWNWIDSAYYCIAVLSTVGYGDFCPTTALGKLLTIAFVLLSVFIVSTLLNSFIEGLLDRQEQRLAQTMKADDGSAESTRWMLSSAASRRVALDFMFLIGFTAVGILYFMKEGTLSVLDALYMVIITITTVGLGDYTPHKSNGKLFALIFMSVGTYLLARFVGSIGEAVAERKHNQFVKERLLKKVDKDEYGILDSDRDGKISQVEYLSRMLVETGEVKIDRIQQILERFKQLDADQSGFLTEDEFGIE